MSLDVYLDGVPSKGGPGTGIFAREAGRLCELSRAEWEKRYPGFEPVTAVIEGDRCFSLNITHNLGRMAAAARLYEQLWRPDEIGITTARQLVEPLTHGLSRLKADPEHFRTFNPPNGWGSYEGLVSFVEQYLDACRQSPDATVRVCR